MSGELVARFENMTPAERRHVALVEYVCRRDGCRLLTIWQEPAGRFFYLKGYKLSADVADVETTDMARAKRTKDGLQRWIPSAGSLDDLIDNPPWLDAESLGLSVNCHHLRNHYISWQELAADVRSATVGDAEWIKLPRSAGRITSL